MNWLRKRWAEARLAFEAWRLRRAGSGPPLRLPRRRWLRVLLAAVGAVVLLWYPIGMAWFHRIDDDLDFQPSPAFTVEGGSRTVATVAALVSQEADHWMANKPFFHPAWPLDNMPNFQLGVVYAAARFAVELGDHLGRVRGSSAIDPDLDRAAGLLRYDGRIWYWSGGLLPTQPAQAQYRLGVRALLSFNRRLASGDAILDRRADNLVAFLLRVAADLGSASAALEHEATVSPGGWLDGNADDVFYNVKGRTYAYYLILRDLRADFSQVIEEKQVGPVWDRMLESLRRAAGLSPWFVLNGSEDSLFVPAHLVSQGFHLLRGRTQLGEIADILVK